MSWWDTGNETDVIGDGAADLAGGALKKIARQRKPKLEELLRAIGLSVGTYASDASALRELVADAKDGSEPVSSGLLRADDSVNDLLPPIRQALGEIAKEYGERWERKPKLSELLSIFAFVLGYRPEDFLEDGAQHPVKAIRWE
jgi:hypothetical protein